MTSFHHAEKGNGQGSRTVDGDRDPAAAGAARDQQLLRQARRSAVQFGIGQDSGGIDNRDTFGSLGDLCSEQVVNAQVPRIGGGAVVDGVQDEAFLLGGKQRQLCQRRIRRPAEGVEEVPVMGHPARDCRFVEQVGGVVAVDAQASR